jgi:hypothetical protein
MTNHPNRKRSYRVVYGETMPAWEKAFSSMGEARAFAALHRTFGDIIFEVSRVYPGEPPKSLMAVLAAKGVSAPG